MPAALTPPPAAAAVAQLLASLQGCEASTVGPSTLHLFWDLVGMLTREPVVFLVDGGTYPIARWGVERAATRGVPVRTFRHHDPAHLQAFLRRNAVHGRRPIVVADGICPTCGRVAPLGAYLDSIKPCRGLLLVDDTQALGVLGTSPGLALPYGNGGGGSVRWAGLTDPNAIVVASLAKAFGAPMAAVSGSRGFIARFESASETRVHCSPPSAAVLHAARSALRVNAQDGDRLREQLFAAVHDFRATLMEAGIAMRDSLFPVQTISLPSPRAAVSIRESLLVSEIHAVAQRSSDGGELSFLFTARHTVEDARKAATAVSRFLRGGRPRRGVERAPCLP